MYGMFKDKIQNCSLKNLEYIFTLYRYIQVRSELYSYGILLKIHSICILM